ncbi:MAG: N-acetylglucosamine-6-phosphate deacetylase [Coriobacteriia bacterium]|nr:N-acetylglucosamine-6-phosphate deacetylase [Coriobacteriia bacterium]
MIFSNANVYTADCVFKRGAVCVENGIIKDVILGDVEGDFDCEGNYLIPGLLDVHFHGCVGEDFCNATEEAIQKICDYQASIGVTQICPATMTYTEDILTPIMEAAANHKNARGADLIGINMEGPFISPNKVGAQNPEYVIKPDYNMILRLQEKANGLIKLVDVAPEVDGGLDFIKSASNDFVISIAHTCTDYKTAVKAFEYGARHMTHLFNAMPGITHREPGPIIAAAEAGADAEIICDGHHIHYAAVRFAFEMFGWDKMVLIADSCEAAGMPDGKYSLGGQPIEKRDGAAFLKNTNTLAGSTTNLFECMKHAHFDADIDLEVAIAAATINPARSIDVDDKYGSIEPGKIANMVLVDKNLDIKCVVLHGNC